MTRFSRSTLLNLGAMAVGLSIVAGAFVAAQTPRPAATAPARPAIAAPVPGPAAGPRRIEVLFLGNEATLHNSNRFAPMLKMALAPGGFNISYTTNPDDLNGPNLSKYDALIFYGNYDAITPAQETALLAFVNGGKGFLPIHSASASFTNSPAYISLVGGQFQRHTTGEFTTTFVKTDHPVMEGMQPFQVWDETYVHTKLSTDRTVLMERVDASGREPWTWVRTQGKGRVFYTAYGHDERVWNNPNFHRLMRNAILWAVDPVVKKAWEAYEIQPLSYTDAAVPIPNYERRAEAPKLQNPLTTAEAARHMQILPGFELTLFASEPLLVGNPEAMAWDEKGRLWVSLTRDYPNNPMPEGEGHDNISIFEDTNKDGKADKVTVFADKLSIPSSLVFSNGGIVVSTAGQFVFLKDTNGDDKADVRQILIPGWGIRDTHAVASNLHYGFDNWLWGTVGYSGFQGDIDGKPLRMSQSVYRFSPDGKHMENMSNFTNNTWGLGFNETNDIFGSTANNEHSVYVAIPLKYYAGVAGMRNDGKKKIDGHYALQANTQKLRQVDSQGGFTAVAGHNFYTARAFPEEYWNRIAFVNEPTGHVVHRAIIERKGSGFAERDGWNLAASDDEWMAPVQSEVGPDGAVWFLDFYDFIIQHNPTPTATSAQLANGFNYQNGKGNAYDTPLRESQKGRIYRLSWKGAKPYTPVSLSSDRPDQLVATLKNDNMFWRMTAQRLLVERGKADVLPGLMALANDRTVDKIGLNSPAVHALWTMHGLGAFDGKNAAALDVARRALTHPAAGVRKAAQSVLPKSAASTADLLAAKVLEDKDLNARLNALLVLSEQPASKDVGRAVYVASKVKENIADEWLPEAIVIAATKHMDGFLEAYVADVGVAAVTRVAVRGARGERDTVNDYSAPGMAETGWASIKVPAIWADTALGEHMGVVWFRKEIDVPTTAAGKAATLKLGIIDDTDVTYINGSRVGGTTNQQNGARSYTVPAGVLLPGRNVIAIKISNTRGRGGIVPDPAGGQTLSLSGEGFSVPIVGQWKDKVEETWEGGRRREFSTGTPLAEQFLLRNSPVTDLVKPDPVIPSAGTGRAGGPGAPGPGGAGPGRGGPPPTLAVALSVITGENKFSQELIAARPGQRVEITFSNTDDMQHNVVIFKRGSLLAYQTDLVGLLTDPTAQARGYVPDTPNVLFSTPLINARTSTTISFVAPTEPGDYPFVCAFPGHWLTMKGILRVE